MLFMLIEERRYSRAAVMSPRALAWAAAVRSSVWRLSNNSSFRDSVDDVGPVADEVAGAVESGGGGAAEVNCGQDGRGLSAP